MPDKIDPLSLPFDLAIDFFKQKVRLPTEKWDDLQRGMHARAFAVAGAMKDDLLADLQTAIMKGLAEGTTIDTFRKDFDQIVQRYGWTYKGGRGWRTRVMFDTNLRTAYQAGRYQQMRDPAVLKRRPYWEYHHGDSRNPRPQHLAWDGLVLPADDPWWETHYPPNGWGCSCKVLAVSKSDLADMGKDGPDTPPADTPGAIDKGWDYNVGQAAYGQQLSDEAMDRWRTEGAKAWERLTVGDWQSEGRPAQVALDKVDIALGDKAADVAELRALIERAIGGPEAFYEYPVGSTLSGVAVNAASLASHVDPIRAPFVPLIPHLLANPFEVWLAFERHRGTGQVVLRHRIIMGVADAKKEGMLMVANAVKGQMEAWTFVPVGDLAYLQRQRVGQLVYGR